MIWIRSDCNLLEFDRIAMAHEKATDFGDADGRFGEVGEVEAANAGFQRRNRQRRCG